MAKRGKVIGIIKMKRVHLPGRMSELDQFHSSLPIRFWHISCWYFLLRDALKEFKGCPRWRGFILQGAWISMANFTEIQLLISCVQSWKFDWSIHHFSQNWNIWATLAWTAMIFFTDIHGAQRMNPGDSGNPMIFPLVLLCNPGLG